VHEGHPNYLSSTVGGFLDSSFFGFCCHGLRILAHHTLGRYLKTIEKVMYCGTRTHVFSPSPSLRKCLKEE